MIGPFGEIDAGDYLKSKRGDKIGNTEVIEIKKFYNGLFVSRGPTISGNEQIHLSPRLMYAVILVKVEPSAERDMFAGKMQYFILKGSKVFNDFQCVLDETEARKIYRDRVDAAIDAGYASL